MARFISKRKEIEAYQFTKNYPLPPGVCICVGMLRPGRTNPLGLHVHSSPSETIELIGGEWIVVKPEGAGYYVLTTEEIEADWEPILEKGDRQYV